MRPLIVALLAIGNASAAPRGLECLARHFALTPTQVSGTWMGKLADGTTLPWSDGKTKTLDEALERPDLHDTLARAYKAGAIRPVTDPNDDPGRVRVDPLFVATYPKRDVHRIVFLGHALEVHDKAAPAFLRVAQRLRTLQRDPVLAPWLAKFSGTFVERNIAGTDRPSSHSYGISIDLDAARTQYWRWDHPPRWHNKVPHAIVDAFEAEGFIWGGRWYHYDTMHFEYRPELLDPDCAP